MTVADGAGTRATAPSFTRVRSSGSVADTVVDEIESIIMRDKLEAGHRLGTKQELAEQFGVAPATLGEALRVLRARGLVEARPGPGGGVFVTFQSPLIRLAHSVLALREGGATVNEVVEVLDALDEAVVRDAAAHRTAADLADLDALMTELSQVWHDPVEGLHCNWRLHRRIAEISPNAVLRTFYLNLVDYIEGDAEGDDGHSLAVPGFQQDTEERLRIHFELVEAIRSGDADELRSAVVAHRTLGR
jgi:GntR family transcriptional regulator, transcriptional repressor for pyruvate dehydrogenase complex